MSCHVRVLLLADQGRDQDASGYVDPSFMLGKWQGIDDTCEIWIDEDQLFLGTPDRIYTAFGSKIISPGLGIVSSYKVEKGKLYRTINGVIDPSWEGRMPVRYSEDTMGFVINNRLSKLYRVEKGVPSIQDTREWQEAALREINSRTPKVSSKESYVLRFDYLGYGDSTLAMLVGHVYELSEDSINGEKLKPLAEAIIWVTENNETTTTNSKGEFGIGFEEGRYSISVSKLGYQSIRLDNYVSDPDQVSQTKIVLVKGSGLRAFEIPAWHR